VIFKKVVTREAIKSGYDGIVLTDLEIVDLNRFSGIGLFLKRALQTFTLTLIKIPLQKIRQKKTVQ
jgi:hypothetical protein